ncbi:MAG: PIG-L deacetylase family protein [Lachnospiraceae bacterium]|nr:PIG-L deacetylase family protein [Lachnospiraceae bacterium]
MNILAIAAHQDDIEMNCLGTMIRYVQQGHSVTHLVLTNGDKGGQFDLSLSYEEVAATRDREAGNMAAKLGARYICLHEEDEYLMDSAKIRDRVTEIIRQVKPDVVFIPPLVDYNLDHTEAGRISFQAVITAAFNTIKTETAALGYYPAVFYMEPTCASHFTATHYVDITDVFEEKCRLLQCHESQMKNMNTSSGWDLVEYAEIVGRFRGLQSGVRYAESFCVCTEWPRATTKNNLLP